jgi:adenylate cyclase
MRLPRLLDASLYSIAIVVLIAALIDLRWLHWVAPVDSLVSDAMVKYRARAFPPDKDIVVVDIDDRSLAELAEDLGRFPWPRVVYGELIEEFERQGAAAVVLDVELYEPDRARPDFDRVLNDVVKGTTNTFFPIRLLGRIARDEGVTLANVPELQLGKRGTPDPATRVTMELPYVLDKSAWGRTGLIDFLPDDDGIGRRYWLRREFGGYVIPSLPMRVASTLGWKVPDGDALTLAWSTGRDPTHPHPRVSFVDLYRDFSNSKRERPKDEFKGKVVVIGSTATHLQDFRTTPIDNLYPGVEILATAIDNLKQGRHFVSAPQWLPYVVVLVLFLPLFVVLKQRANLITIFALLILASFALAGTAYAALAAGSLQVPIGTPLVYMWVFFLLAALRAYIKEQRAKEQREMVLSRFLDRRLVKQLVAEGVKLEDFKSESRTITVLFSDIRGFTSLSETRPPEEVVALLNRYLSAQAETVFRHGGTLDKFIGDAIMAFWNAPTDDPQHAERAVGCALDMVGTLARFNADNATSGATGGIQLDIGVGLHSGPAVVGFVGSQRKLEYTAIGDTVNLASRIEGETKGRARILVSSATADMAGAAFTFAEVAEVTVKGRSATVRLLTPEVKS